MLKKKIEFLLRSFNFKTFIFVVTKILSHTYFKNREKAQPIFDWGKYQEREGKFMMPSAVQVHHAFVDGIHIGKLADKLQRYLDEV
jgi:Chloramphenicol O-acetyltransferase